MKRLAVLLPLLLLAATVGCQTNPKFQEYNDRVDEEMGPVMKVPVYLWDRFLDLTDIVQLNLAFGGGALFNVHATKAFQFGGGYRDGVCFGLQPRSFGMWHEIRGEGGISFAPFFLLYYKDYSQEALWGTTTLFDRDIQLEGMDYLSNRVTHVGDVGISVHAIVGLDLNVSPFQFLDFVFGFFGMPFLVPVDPIGFGTELDLGNDDLRARKVRNDYDGLNYYAYYLEEDLVNIKCTECGCEVCICNQ